MVWLGGKNKKPDSDESGSAVGELVDLCSLRVVRVCPSVPSRGNPPGAFTRGHDGYGIRTAQFGDVIHGWVDADWRPAAQARIFAAAAGA
jgi:hypothetical protein